MIRICLYSCAAGVLLCSTASAIVNPTLFGGGIGLGRRPLGLSVGIGTLHASQLGIGPSLSLGRSGLGINAFLLTRLGPASALTLPSAQAPTDRIPGLGNVYTSDLFVMPDPRDPDPVLEWSLPDGIMQGPNTDPAAYMPPIPDGPPIP